ncbi:MAG: hypothetical protein EOO07_18850, partial [Chitinophagaceae bacterium]
MAGENINRKINIYINGKEVVNSLSGVQRAMAQTRGELKHLNKGSDDYDKKVVELTNRLEALNAKQDDFRSELKLTSKDLGAARSNFTNLLSGLAVGNMKDVQAG